jgi:aspartyl-tRNA(Asn)/glutamyl-tRNA(Gln) amidotransferase subunit A
MLTVCGDRNIREATLRWVSPCATMRATASAESVRRPAVGLQIVGPYGADGAVLRAAAAFEAARPWAARRPAL